MDNQRDGAAFVEINDRGSRKVVVTFGGLGNQVGVPFFEFRQSLDRLGVSTVFFRDINQSWYHSPIDGFGETFALKAAKIGQILDALAASERYFVGASAGGFAALLFAGLVGGVRASLTFGPQVFIDKRTRAALSDGRWPQLISRIRGADNRNIAEVADKIQHPASIIVGGANGHDIKHALYARGFIKADILVLSQGRHNPAKELKAGGVLGDILKEFVETGAVGERKSLRIEDRDAQLIRL